jgi:hypothetical protein
MNWPKDYLIVCKNRPGTHMARMEVRNGEWRQNSSKRYSREGAQRAFDTLRKQHRGLDWGIFHVPTKILEMYTEKVHAGSD